MDEFELPETQTQEDYIEASQEEPPVVAPWGRLWPSMTTMATVDLRDLKYTFGRAPNCNIVIEKSDFPSILNVSKEHFSLHRDADDIVYITDLSKNGTFVNNVKVGRNRRQIIHNDDVIALGHPSAKIYTFTCNICSDYPAEMKRKYVISKKLGQGGFGEVRMAHDKRSLQKFAVKRISKAKPNYSSSGGCVSRREKIKTEIEILTTFSYVFIIQMIEVFENDNDVFLVLEYMAGGELTSRMLSALPFPESEVKFIFYQILLGLRYLHMSGVTHRDLKPENVLLFSNNDYPLVKITDFGLSKMMDETSMMETVCGTISYVAPEVLRYNERYNKKVDVWSLGVMLFYMLSKTQPFRGECREELARNIFAGKPSWDMKIWRSITYSSKNLIGKMLTVDPQVRISTADIFRHDWIEKDNAMKARVEHFLYTTFDTSSSEEILSAPVPKRPKLSIID